MGFRVKFETKEQFISGLKELKEIGALGENIGIGTYLPNNVVVNELISGELDIYTENPSYDEDIMEFSIGESTDYMVEEYKHLLGKNNIYISLTTYYDCVLNNDVYDKTVTYENMIEETLKLIKELKI